MQAQIDEENENGPGVGETRRKGGRGRGGGGGGGGGASRRKKQQTKQLEKLKISNDYEKKFSSIPPTPSKKPLSNNDDSVIVNSN